MNRVITKKIVEWYEKQDERILCIYGGRRIGKTWIVKEFCQQYDREYTYISLRDKEMEDIQVKFIGLVAQCLEFVENDGSLEDRYHALLKYLRTVERYEIRR